MLEPCDAKVSSTVLRGPGDRKVAWLLGKNAKRIIWRKRFGVRGLFAFSGSSNTGPVPCATPRSPGSRVGAFIIASPVHWVVPRVQTTASCSIQSATIGFIANIFPYRNRVSLKEAFEGLEPDDGKLSRPVLRGLAPSNGGRLLGIVWLRHLLGWMGSAFSSREDEPTFGRGAVVSCNGRSFSRRDQNRSPCIRGAPQVGFWATIWKINSRTSFGVRLLPTCVRTLKISLQYIRKPVRCQRATVSGVTTMRARFHPDQNRRTTTQKNLSSRPRLGRRCRRLSTASCCRSKRFSNTRFPRLRERRISAPIQRKRTLNMARTYIRSTIGNIVVSC